MEKLVIKNQENQEISVVIEKPQDPRGLAFVMHGLGANKEQPQLVAIASAFVENGYIAIRFDARNTYGESQGNYENANVSNYLEDLKCVINWSSQQSWYIEPFILSGSSLGGMCSLLYAEEYPDKVKAIFSKAAVISGKLSLQHYPKDKLTEWTKTGWRIDQSGSIPGLKKRLNWEQFINDKLKYDVLDGISRLTMPVFIVYGSEDAEHIEHQKVLYEALPGPKDIQVINGAPHTIRDADTLKLLKSIFEKWINILDKV